MKHDLTTKIFTYLTVPLKTLGLYCTLTVPAPGNALPEMPLPIYQDE
jgi:hypothetical protein